MLALALSGDYEYIQIDNKSTGATVCFISAGIYTIYPIFAIVFLFRKNPLSCCKKKAVAEVDIPLIESAGWRNRQLINQSED